MLLSRQPQNTLLCHAYLKRLYRHQKHAGFQYNLLEGTQGDISYRSMSKLIEKMQLSNEDVFTDLGSGTGKVLFHVFLLSEAKKVVGIEMQSSLHKLALQKKERVLTELPVFFNPDREIHLFHGDFLKNIYQGTTVAFISAVCFSQTTLQDLAIKLNALPHLRSIFSLKPLTYLNKLYFKTTFQLQCSWGSALCYWYGSK